jgi:pimeloyl-ACP methyl ester carboxylesterase
VNPPLVLLPGSGCSPDLWSGLGLGEQVVHGALDAPTLDGCVERLLGALPPRFKLAGLSLGGIVAMALVRRAPERVAALGLLATNARPPTDAQHAAWARQREALAAGRTARDLQCDLLPALTARRTPEQDERVLAMADAVGGRIWDAQLRLQATRVDERPGLRDVRVPTLVLAGEHDTICPVANHVEIAAAVPGAELHVLPGAGHLLPLDAPDAIGAFLQDLRGSSRNAVIIT